MDVLAVLQRLGGNGRLLEKLDDALKKTAAEVVETGNAGTVTITLKLYNKSQGDPIVMIDESVGRTVPKEQPRGAFFYMIEGELHKDDPRQPQLPHLRGIDGSTGEIHEVEPREKVERSVL